MPKPTPLLHALRAELSQHADPARALEKQAYMKSTMPFWGVSNEATRSIAKRLIAAHPIDDAETFMRDVREVWDAATHREERYAAIDFTADKRARAFHTKAILPLYEHMIRTGAWWDLVDAIVPARFLLLFEKEPSMPRVMRAWANSEDMWMRRAAILSQLKRKTNTDLALLEDCLAPSLTSKEFFLRKAIGWSLRELSKKNAGFVKQYVDAHRAEMSGLSIREAEKHFG
jgi:3-methyladenine DNA glycosylase AlkD